MLVPASPPVPAPRYWIVTWDKPRGEHREHFGDNFKLFDKSDEALAFAASVERAGVQPHTWEL